MDKKIGFIGCGNMGSAMVGGILRAQLVEKEQLTVSCRSRASADRISETYGIRALTNNQEVAAWADILFLAVKPPLFAEVIPEIREAVTGDKLVVSIAAGKSIAAIEAAFEKEIHLIRMMPNTPALVGEAMSAISPNNHATAGDLGEVQKICESFGQAEVVPEAMMDAVVGVSGSSPAYVYMMIEAMADAAVADGMPRKQAYTFAAQSVLGAAKMVLDTGRHPGELKDEVCSPGGTTIAAVATLETGGLRDTVISAQRACVARSRELGKD